MIRASGDLWIGTNYAPMGWDRFRNSYDGVHFASVQVGGVLCGVECVFGLRIHVPENDPLAVLCNTHYGSNLPGRSLPVAAPDLDTVLEVRAKLLAIGLRLHEVHYPHLAEGYLPLNAETAWEYAAQRELRVVVADGLHESELVPPFALGLRTWADASLYLESAWCSAAANSGTDPRSATCPDSWSAAAVFPNSD